MGKRLTTPLGERDRQLSDGLIVFGPLVQNVDVKPALVPGLVVVGVVDQLQDPNKCLIIKARGSIGPAGLQVGLRVLAVGFLGARQKVGPGLSLQFR